MVCCPPAAATHACESAFTIFPTCPGLHSTTNHLAQVVERAVQLRIAADAVAGDVGQQLAAVRQRIGGVLQVTVQACVRRCHSAEAEWQDAEQCKVRRRQRRQPDPLTARCSSCSTQLLPLPLRGRCLALAAPTPLLPDPSSPTLLAVVYSSAPCDLGQPSAAPASLIRSTRAWRNLGLTRASLRRCREAENVG